MRASRLCAWVLMGCAAAAIAQAQVKPQLNPRAGTITVLKQGAATVHSYTAPAEGLFVTSQIIETAHQLVIVDAQYTEAHAREVLEYARSLGKPIARLYVSHAHPDHWNGLQVFAGTPVWTLPAIRDEIAGRARSGAGDLHAVSSDALSAGFEILDGLRFDYLPVGAAEGSAHLVIGLPQIRTLVAQDLVYHRVHLYSGQGAAEAWQRALQPLRTRDDVSILPGHGTPAGREVYDEMSAYLADLVRLRAESPDGAALKQALLTRHPDYVGERLIDISLPRLYPAPR